MSKILDLYNIIEARWNPGEEFTIQEMYEIGETERITHYKSTIQREMPRLVNMGIISYVRKGQGKYRRIAIKNEAPNNPLANIKHASSRIPLERKSILKVMLTNRIQRAVEAEIKRKEESIVKDIKSIETEVSSETQRSYYLKARLGQGHFRDKTNSILAKMRSYRMCIKIGSKSFSYQAMERLSNLERLDEYNGILLIPNIDTLFDLGLITFDGSGKLIQSQTIKAEKTNFFNLTEEVQVQFHTKHQVYLEFHRTQVFFG